LQRRHTTIEGGYRGMKGIKIVWGMGLVLAWVIVSMLVTLGVKVPMLISPIISGALVVATTLFIMYDLYERLK